MARLGALGGSDAARLTLAQYSDNRILHGDPRELTGITGNPLRLEYLDLRDRMGGSWAWLGDVCLCGTKVLDQPEGIEIAPHRVV